VSGPAARRAMSVSGPLWIVADDLTGSADAALPFWRAGRRCHIVFDSAAAWPANPGVLSVCTHSRAMDESAARAAVAAAAKRLPRDADVFKKIDSTLRGWIGAESSALLDALPGRRAVLAPCYPTKGRTLAADGVYRVHGTPLTATEFAAEVTGLPADSTLPAFVARHFGPRTADVAVIPSSSDAEFAAAVAAVAPPALWIGSPGLAIALAGPSSRPSPAVLPPDSLAAAPIVVAAGSRRSLTARQVDRLAASVRPGPDHTLHLLRVDEPDYRPERSADLADDLGRRAAAATRLLGATALILTGGDIAAATCRHLGITGAEIVAEIEDGLPVLRAGPWLLVTKAGGFGDEFSLVRAYAKLAALTGAQSNPGRA
jgi:uncharacterized protein YgbK (DUF1537 family)